jgi:hypothetical protein
VKTIGYIFAVILIFFGVLFIWSAFSPDGQTSNMVTGIITAIIGFGIIWFVSRRGPAKPGDVVQQTTLNVELPSDVDIERFKCQDCGAQLSMDNVKMVAGAPMVDCPYCGAAYQLSETPKW